MPVMVEQVTPTKSGKAWRVRLGGTYYNAFKDSGIENYVGKMIEAEIQTSEKFGPSIAAFRPVAGQSVAAPQVTPPSQGGLPPAPAPAVAAPRYAEPSDNLTPWYWPSVSNLCAALVAKGVVTKPEELNMWCLKMAQVAVSVKEVVK